MLALRTAARCVPEVRAVPHLLPQYGAPRRAARYHQVQLVTAGCRSITRCGRLALVPATTNAGAQRPPTTPEVPVGLMAERETVARRATRP
jgi:hypothetical protein